MVQWLWFANASMFYLLSFCVITQKLLVVLKFSKYKFEKYLRPFRLNPQLPLSHNFLWTYQLLNIFFDKMHTTSNTIQNHTYPIQHP